MTSKNLLLKKTKEKICSNNFLVKLRDSKVVLIATSQKIRLKEKVGQDFTYNKKTKKKRLTNGCK